MKADMKRIAWIVLGGTGWIGTPLSAEPERPAGPHEGKAVSRRIEERLRFLEDDMARLREAYLEEDPELAGRLDGALELLRFSPSERRPVADRLRRMHAQCGAGAMGSALLEARLAEADIEAVIQALLKKEEDPPPHPPRTPRAGPGDDGELPPDPHDDSVPSTYQGSPIRLADPFGSSGMSWGQRVPIDPEKSAVLKPRGERIPPEYEEYVLAYWSRLSGTVR